MEPDDFSHLICTKIIDLLKISMCDTL